MKLGVGITTHNRPDIFERTVKEWRNRLPEGAVLVVVDDASDVPADLSVAHAGYRFEQNVGIARAKNKCLELLVDRGCSDLFLADDDTWPLVDDWWEPYVNSPEPHLMYTWGGGGEGNTAPTYSDTQHTAWPSPCGCLLYVHASVLDVVGGFNPEYQRWGYEHVDFSRRIHNAGLTTWPYADVTGADDIWCALDRTGTTRSVPKGDRKRLHDANKVLVESYWDSADYVPYRPARDVVLTQFLTSSTDPQRNIIWEPDFAKLDALLDSLTGHEAVVLTDAEPPTRSGVEFVKVPTAPTANPYYQRWLVTYQWLRANPEVGRVWCVDGTDVVLQRDPWSWMRADRLYLGHERATVSTPWMPNNHGASITPAMLAQHGGKPILNTGIAGGRRGLVQAFIHDMLRTWHEQMRRGEPDMSEMGIFNVLGYTTWAHRVETGPHIVTEFKRFRDNGTAAWRHK